MRKNLVIPSRLALLIAATPFFAAVKMYDIAAPHSNIGFNYIPARPGPNFLLDAVEIEMNLLTRAASPQ